jgi:hypothetical protein
MKKRLCGLVLGLGMIAGCASAPNVEIYGLGQSIYPTSSTDAERVEMRDREIKLSEIELQNNIKYREMFDETKTNYGFNLLKIRF